VAPGIVLERALLADIVQHTIDAYVIARPPRIACTDRIHPQP